MTRPPFDVDPLWVAPERFYRAVTKAPARLTAGELVIASLALFLGLLAIAILAATFGPVAAFFIGLPAGWVLRGLDDWVRPRGG